MYLKSIDLYGFKSFANKMNFHFEKGITGIVGPNGSGKSNVSDAVRWVLGEQSAKQLRGSKMEDVIFAGTENRKALGYCQVDLTIDNQDRKMGIDYSEVTISRRVYRSGESNYYINGTQCRLKDVQELFMDTGVGREGYSIIGQGQVDKILSSKPTDRRDLFDEAAGIVKYKTRKEAAISKLERSQQDLERITDIILELEKQKEGLEKQAEKARVFLDYREELKQLEVSSFLSMIDDFEDKLAQLKLQLEQLETDLGQKKEQLIKITRDHDLCESEFEEADQELEQNREKITETSLDIEKLQSTIQLLEQESKHRLENIEQSRKEQSSFAEGEIEQRREINQLELSLREQSELQKNMTAELNERQKLNMELEAERKSKEARIEEIQTNLIQELNQASTLKGEVHRQELILENNKARIHQLKIKENLLDKTLEEMKKELSGYDVAIESFEDAQKKLLDDKMKLRKKAGKAYEALQLYEKEMESERGQLQRLLSRHEALQELEEGYDGYYFSVKKVMEQNHPKVLGVIAELIRVDATYTKAIETALGSAMQNIVTENEKIAKEMIDFLKKGRYGRATFLPLTRVRGDLLTGVTETDGYLGLASEHIECDPKYQGVIRQLLGRILLTDNMEHALELAKKNNNRYRIITLEGDVISAGGAMTGGAFKSEKGQFLSRRQEIDTLDKQIKDQTVNVQEFEAKIQASKLSQEEYKKAMEVIQEEEQNKNLDYQDLIHRKEALVQEDQRQTKELNAIRSERKDLEDQTIETEKEHEESQHFLENQETNHQGAEIEVKTLSEAIEILKDDLSVVQEEMTNEKIQLQSIEQEKTHIQQMLERIRSELNERQGRLDTLQETIQKNELENLKIQESIKAARVDQDQKKESLDKLNTTLHDLRLKRQEIQVRKGQLDAKRELMQNDVSSLEKDLIRISGQIDKNEMQKEARINYMWDEYELTYSTAQEVYVENAYSDTGLKQRVGELKSLMKQLGDVNVKAIEEFRDVKERYTFLKEQEEDLTGSKEKLMEIIKDLDQKMSDQFREKFKEINSQFNRVFKELFGGGKGFLELTDQDNILTSGITIVAQPPGKKLQNMMLLSGGERAFTAIALLFSIQSLRPSPFCILDEIEAALDDANVDRFADYLKKLTDQTQFIVITHRKGTMESADALYGITMQEKGVSTQVSVKLVQEQLDQQEQTIN